MKLLGSTKSEIIKNEYSEVVLVHCNVVNNGYQRGSKVLHTFVPNKSFGQLLDFSSKIFYFQKILIQSLLIKILNRKR